MDTVSFELYGLPNTKTSILSPKQTLKFDLQTTELRFCIQFTCKMYTRLSNVTKENGVSPKGCLDFYYVAAQFSFHLHQKLDPIKEFKPNL